MRVLVTGATGFLGRYLMAELSRQGCEIVALVHKSVLPNSLPASQVIEGDIRDSDLLSAAVAQVDAVCHFAAFIPPDFADPAFAETCLQINALATLKLAEATLKKSGCRFVHLSSANAYAFTGGSASEANPLYPAERATYYLGSKIVGELYVEHLRRVAGLPAFCFRISSAYGWGMTEKSVVARFMASAHQGATLQVWDGGVTTYDFVHVTDVVKLVAKALQEGEPGIYNAGSGVAHTVLELARAVVDTYPERKIATDVKPAAGPAPASFSALSIDKANKMWGYNPLSLEQGLLDYRKRMQDGD